MIKATEVLEAIKKAKQSKSQVIIESYEPATDLTLNEYCLFFKPELTENENSFEKIFEAVSDVLEQFEQSPSAACVIEASHLVNHKIMNEHYGVIDLVSRFGSEVLSDEAKHNLAEKVANGSADFELLGANQFLDKYNYFNPVTLAVLYDNLQNIKLAGGTHCVKANVKGKDTVIFNGFHPEQLERYTTPGTIIVCFVFQTKTAWKTLRAEMTGLTNPQNSPIGSIRKTLFEKKEMLNLEEVSSGKNGIHVSAGPLEGMIEIMRFFGKTDNGNAFGYEGTTFGKLLKANGLSGTEINEIASNPDVLVDGKQFPIFDVSEETDATSACEKIVNHFKGISNAE